MSDATNRSNARKARPSDSKVDVRKSSGSKTEDALFALAAGAMGLGIALLKQEQAHAAAQNVDSVLDQTPTLSDGLIDGQTMLPELLVTEMSATPGQVVDAELHPENPEAASVTRLADDLPVSANLENIAAIKGTDSVDNSGPEQSSTSGKTTSTATKADTGNVQEGLSVSDEEHNDVGEAVAGVLGDGMGLLSGVGETLDDTLDTVDELLASVLGVDGDEGGLLGGVGDVLDGSLDAVGDLATGLLRVDDDNGGLLPGASDSLDGTLDIVGDIATAPLGGGDPTSNTVSILGSEDQPSLLDAVNQALSMTDAGTDGEDSTLSFIGQPVLDSDAQHDADNPHGNLLHMLT